MNLTNKYNLPQGIYDAISKDSYDIGHADYSLSQLATPPQQRRLIQLNHNSISIDISDEIWKLLGTSVHYILAKAQGKTESELQLQTAVSRSLLILDDVQRKLSVGRASILETDWRDIALGLKEARDYLLNPSSFFIKTETRIIEERMYMRLGGKIISGKSDWIELLSNAIKIEDYKVTSVWKILKGDYSDWTFQLNGYNLLADSNNIKVDNLQVNAILKDWKKFEYNQKRDEKYPEHPVAVISIEKWDLIDTTRIILNKMSEHEMLKVHDDPEMLHKLRPCTNEEKWHGEDKYAVMKENNVKASKVFDTEVEAWEYISGRTDGVYKVEPRLGEDKRCEEFCLAKPFCAQYKKEHSISILPVNSKGIDTSILPSDIEIIELKIEAREKTVDILNDILAESNQSTEGTEIKSSPATINEADVLLEEFRKKKPDVPKFDLDAFLMGEKNE